MITEKMYSVQHLRVFSCIIDLFKAKGLITRKRPIHRSKWIVPKVFQVFLLQVDDHLECHYLYLIFVNNGAVM